MSAVTDFMYALIYSGDDVFLRSKFMFVVRDGLNDERASETYEDVSFLPHAKLHPSSTSAGRTSFLG